MALSMFISLNILIIIIFISVNVQQNSIFINLLLINTHSRNNNLFRHQVKLTKFDDKQKVALIKEIKGLLEGYNLVQAKKFVESVPAVVKADVSKDEAEKLKEALSKVGGVIEIE